MEEVKTSVNVLFSFNGMLAGIAFLEIKQNSVVYRESKRIPSLIIAAERLAKRSTNEFDKEQFQHWSHRKLTTGDDRTTLQTPFTGKVREAGVLSKNAAFKSCFLKILECMHTPLETISRERYVYSF